MELKDFVAAVIALVAVGVSVFALKHSNRSVKAADAANSLAKEALDMQQDIDRRTWVVFELNDRGRNRYELRNEGTRTAPKVVLNVGDLGIDDSPVKELGDFEPGRVEAMYLQGGYDLENEKVRVNWEWPDGTREYREFLVD